MTTRTDADNEPLDVSDRPRSWIRASYALFIFAVISKLWAAPITQEYKIHYIAYFLCAAPLVLSVFSRRMIAGQVMRAERPLLLFFVYLFCSIFWAYSMTTTLVSTLFDSLYLLVFWIAYVLLLNVSLSKLSFVFELIPIGVALVSIWGLVRFGEVRQEGMRDAEGMGTASTILSFHLTAAIPFLIRSLYARRRRLATAALIATVPLTLLLQSRAGLGANVLVALLTVVDFNRRHRRRIFLIAVGAMTAMAVVIAIFSTVDFDERTLLGRVQHATTFSFLDAEEELKNPDLRGEDLERRLQWLVAYEAFVNHPFGGVGYGGIGDIFDDHFGYVISSHGFITTLLGETGLVGTAIFLLVVIAYFRRIGFAIRASDSEEQITFFKASRVGMIGLIVVGLFHQVYQDQLFYIFLAWGYAAPELVDAANRAAIERRS